jgi:hypothetical protein
MNGCGTIPEVIHEIAPLEQISGNLILNGFLFTGRLHYFASTIILYSLMGATFVMIRTLISGHILTVCPNQFIGRVQSSLNVMLNIVSVLVFVAPTIFSMENFLAYYTILGLIILLSYGLMLFSKW